MGITTTGKYLMAYSPDNWDNNVNLLRVKHKNHILNPNNGDKNIILITAAAIHNYTNISLDPQRMNQMDKLLLWNRSFC